MPENKNKLVENLNENSDHQQPKDSSKGNILFYVMTLITALLIIAIIIGGAFFFIIKTNLNGVADNMRDKIEGIPILNQALPNKPDPDDEKNMSEDMVRSKYTELNEQKKLLEQKIEELTKNIENTNSKVAVNETNTSLLQQQKQTLESEQQKLVTENNKLKLDMDKLSETVAVGDKEGYKQYYEKLDSKVAAEIYEKIIKQEKVSAEVKKYCSIYEEMDASAVAGIMEKMGTSKMPLIIEIMKNLKKDSAGEILAEMTPEFASKVSENLAKAYNVLLSKSE